MKRFATLIGSILALTFVVLALREKYTKAPIKTLVRQFLRPNGLSNITLPVDAVTSPPLSDQNDKNIGKVLAAYKTPIEFFGKITDEQGRSVGDANIYFSVADRYFGESSKYIRTSDQNGLFSISGITGAGIYVEVSKEGYYRLPDKSYGSFGYGVSTGRDAPSKENPAIFVMRKKGQAVPLIKINEHSIKVPKNGVPIEVALDTGHTVPLGEGDIRIECWAQDDFQDPRAHYAWGGRISVPGGGLLLRTGDFDFTAPVEGYIDHDDIGPSEQSWSPTAERHYFVKTASGRFARLSARIHAGGEHFFVIESFLNPEKGSTNLEYDPTKTVPESRH